MSINLTVVIKSKPEHLSEVKQMLEDLVVQTKKEEACLQYDLHQGTEDKNVFVFHEIWRDKQGLELHDKQPYIRNFIAAAPEKFQEFPQIYFVEKL